MTKSIKKNKEINRIQKSQDNFNSNKLFNQTLFMKKQLSFFWILSLLFTILNGCQTQLDPLTSKTSKKVVCIGNSITYGAGISNREAHSYPAVLGQMLGEDYIVRNFGISGCTMLNKGDNPYMNQEAYRSVLQYQPDIVIIKLGTNDSKPQNWAHKQEFKQDMITMINSFKQIESHPSIYVCYPAKVYSLDQWGINDDIIRNEIIPVITEAANECNVKIINIYAATENMSQNFPDNVHPNEAGARVIATEVYSSIIH